MIGLWFIILLIAGLLIANKIAKTKERWRQEAFEWIRDVDKRWVGSADDRVGLFYERNDMDQVIIDLQPDGYLVEDEHDYDDIDDNQNE
jgi:hypothetical protein